MRAMNWAIVACLATGAASALAASVIRAESQKPYLGSSFNEIRSLIFDSDGVQSGDPVVQAERELYRRGELPEWPVTVGSIWRHTKHGLMNLLAKRAKATLVDHDDYYDRLEKTVHPTGLCFAGEWRITEPTPYGGYFATGAHGLLIGRASSASGVNVAGHQRPLGFAGKIFPTVDPDAVVETINFVTIDNLGGTLARHFLDVSPTNAPPTGFAFVPVQALETFFSLIGADSHITSRPIRQIAEGGPSPQWLFLRAAPGMPRIDEPDFRRELDASRYPGGIILETFGSNTTHDTTKASQWSKLGEITLKESKISYACDRQLHFHHERAAAAR